MMFKLKRLLDNWGSILLLIIIAILIIPFSQLLSGEAIGLPKIERLVDILLSLIPELIGAILIFFALERGLKILTGITEHEKRPLDKFIYYVGNKNHTSHRVKILETFTDLIIDQYRESFEDAALKAVQRGVKIQILLLHPKTEGALQRQDDLKQKGIDVKREMQIGLARFFKLQNRLNKEAQNGGSIEIRLYDALPSIAMYMWNDYAYVSFYPSSEKSDESANLEVSMSTLFGRYVHDQFNSLWNAPKTIPLDSHMRLLIKTPDIKKPLLYKDFYFAFSNKNDYEPKYASTTYRSLVEVIRNKDLIKFSLDNKVFESKAYIVDNELEIKQAIILIKERYEWAEAEINKKIGADPYVISFEDVTIVCTTEI